MSTLQYITQPGESYLEGLPAELLHKILIFVTVNPISEISQVAKALQDPKAINTPRKPALTSLPCLLTSRTMQMATLSVMYRNILTSSPSTFSKFMTQLRSHPALGQFVRSLDLAPISRTAQSDEEPPILGVSELLHLTPLLQDFTAHPGFQQHLDQQTIHQLFTSLHYLEVVNLSNCNSPSFAWEMAQACCNPRFRITPTITTLNLSGCLDFPPLVFETLLAQLPVLQHLNVGCTQITAKALVRIPPTAQLTHLNVNACSFLTGSGLTTFLATHPGTRTLVALHAQRNAGIQHLFEDDVTTILASLPRSLRVLNLKNASMTAKHLPLLQQLSRQLTELSVGSHLSLRDVEALFLPPQEEEPAAADDEHQPEPMDAKYDVVLDPLAEAVAICQLRARIKSTAALPLVEQPSLAFLDVSSLSIAEQSKIKTSVLLGKQAARLRVVEVSEKMVGGNKMLAPVCRAVGWGVKSNCGKSWLVRDD